MILCEFILCLWELIFGFGSIDSRPQEVEFWHRKWILDPCDSIFAPGSRFYLGLWDSILGIREKSNLDPRESLFGLWEPVLAL